jgi:peptidoglycan/xylan/chitin deacetylase (PgdA/CDA1 family)
VTFDDGYRDNLTQALPILERYEIPATVFVVSGTVGSSREFWWDTIERCVLSPHKLPDVLELSVGGASQRWRLDDDDRADMAPDGWHADLQEPSTVRQRLFLDVWRSLVHCEPRERDAVIDGLMAWAGVGRAPQSRLPLSRPELAELAAHPLITIGCHTVSHAALPDLPPDQQRREIETCRCALEDWTARKVATFAYPYGRYDDVTAAVVRDLGYAAVCTTEPWPVTPLSRRWELPRLQVTDVDGEGFERWLRPHLRSDSRALSA